jgi:hypothetical protein
VPLVDRIVRLVSMLADNNATMSWLDAAPAGHRHDGGFWVACPFCADDPLGMCSACDGTRQIWEMPREADGVSTTTPAELDAVVNSHTVDALARRVDALEYTVRNLQRLAQQTHGPEAGL